MDEAGARGLMERLSMTEQPPSRVDIGLARQRGGVLLRRRRLGLAGIPVLAAATVVALVLGAGAIGGARGGGPGIQPAPQMMSVVRHPFNPAAPYAAFGWLPQGMPRNVTSPGSTLAELELAAGSLAGDQFSLSVWAPAACQPDAGQVRAALRRHHHPMLDCNQPSGEGWATTLSRAAPSIAGHPAFWFYGHMLAWEYAPHAWATLYSSRPGTAIPDATIVKVAAHVRFAAAAKPMVKFPFQLTGLPPSWRLLSVAGWRATADGLLAGTSRELGSSTSVGRADGPATGTIGYLAITPGQRRCAFFQHSSDGSSERVVLNGVTAIVTQFTGGPAGHYQGLCVPETDGLHVMFLEYPGPGHAGFAFGGVAGVFTHHLHLLGPDPAHWTTAPLG
jgi:hypothetical protein